MAVIPIKTLGRCKLCQSPHRAVMDALLELRSAGAEDDAGQRVNFEYVAARYAELHDGAKLTKENCTLHFRNHCQVQSEGEALDSGAVLAENYEARLAVLERVLGENWREVTPSVDQILELQRALYVLELERRMATGADLGLTHDHFLKGADSSTKRKAEESQSLLLRTLTGGIARSLVRAEEPKSLPAGEEVVIEDAEVVDGG